MAYVLLILIFAVFGIGVYDIFFKKNPNELTNLEKKFIDPEVAKVQTQFTAGVNTGENEVKTVVDKVGGKL